MDIPERIKENAVLKVKQNNPYITNVNISKADPTIKITDTGDSKYSTWTRTDTNSKMDLKNYVKQTTTVNGYCFNAAGSYQMTVANDTDFNLQTFTVEFWFKHNTGSWGVEGLVTKSWYTYDSKEGWEIIAAGGAGFWRVGTGASYQDVMWSLPADTNWHHVIAEYDEAGYQRFYLDNSEQGVALTGVAGNPTYSNPSYPNSFRVGNWLVQGGTNYFGNIKIDEVRVYNRILTAGERATHYASGSGEYGSASESGLLAGWHFDEGSGTSVADYQTTSDNDGTMSSASWVAGEVAKATGVITWYEVDVLGSTDNASYQGTQWLGDDDGATEIRGSTILLDNSTTIGNGTAATDYTLTFDGESNDGIITWMEGESRFDINSHFALKTDSNYLYFGTGYDMGVYYDGTAGNIDTDLVAASDLTIDCGTDKTLVLEVPVYEDINFGMLMLGSGGTKPGTVQIKDNDGDNTGIYTLGFAVGEEVSGCIEVPHNYKEGTNLTFHVHWGGNTAPGGGTDNVQWQLTYSISRDGQTFPDAITIVKETAITAQYLWTRSDFTAINGATGGYDGGAIKIGDQIHFTIKRIAASADEYGDDALVATAGFHYQIDTLGSRTITSK